MTAAFLLLLHRLLSAALWTAQKARLIEGYALDHEGIYYDLLITAYSPRYDNPASGLPRFARWKANGSWFFKLGGMTIIIDL